MEGATGRPVVVLVASLYLYLCLLFTSGTCLRLVSRQSQPSLSGEVKRLIEVLNMPQSLKSRREVEELITVLSAKAIKSPSMYRKQIERGKSYRTLWSSVTSSSILGQLLGQKPSVVLNGPSWQTISSDGKSSENIVQWRLGDFSVRMVGMASLTPLQKKTGYGLVIRGLEFRVAKGMEMTDKANKRMNKMKQEVMKTEIPERFALMGDEAKASDAYLLGSFQLKEDEALRNGVGTLEVLYNDGLVRITEDKVQNNRYIHVLEPYGDLLLAN